jgi:hypothetical protein
MPVTKQVHTAVTNMAQTALTHAQQQAVAQPQTQPPIYINIPPAAQPDPAPAKLAATRNLAQDFPNLGGGGMAGVNRPVVVAVVLIGGTGMLRANLTGQPFTPVMVGSLMLLIFLSLLDLFGGVLSVIASSLALLALVATLLRDLPDIIQALQSAQHKATTATGKAV